MSWHEGTTSPSLPAQANDWPVQWRYRLADHGRDWSVRRVRIWFNNNRNRLCTPGAAPLPLERAVQERLGAVNGGLQPLHDRLDAHKKRVEERHRLLLPRLEFYPEGQLVRTTLRVGRTCLPLRVVADLSFRAFMRESAWRYRRPSVAQLRNAVLRIADQFRLEFTPAAEQRGFCNITVDAATSGAESGSASTSRRLAASRSVDD